MERPLLFPHQGLSRLEVLWLIALMLIETPFPSCGLLVLTQVPCCFPVSEILGINLPYALRCPGSVDMSMFVGSDNEDDQAGG